MLSHLVLSFFLLSSAFAHDGGHEEAIEPLICSLKEKKFKEDCCINQFDTTYNITQLAKNGSTTFQQIQKCNPQVSDGIFSKGMAGFLPCNIQAPKGATFTDEFGVNHPDIYIICDPRSSQTSTTTASTPTSVPTPDPKICSLKEQKFKEGCCVNQFDNTYNITQLAKNGSTTFQQIQKCNPQVSDGIFPKGMAGFMPCSIQTPKGATFTDEFGVNHPDIYIICDPIPAQTTTSSISTATPSPGLVISGAPETAFSSMIGLLLVFGMFI